MSSEVQEQIQRILTARARLLAEISVATAMMPDRVQSTVHFNRPLRAAEYHPEWRDLIVAMYPEAFKN